MEATNITLTPDQYKILVNEAQMNINREFFQYHIHQPEQLELISKAKRAGLGNEFINQLETTITQKWV